MMHSARKARVKPATRPARPATRPAIACDTAVTRPEHRLLHGRDTAGLVAVRTACASSLRSGCAPVAPNPVLDSVHYFSQCFGTLFMSTVHKVFKIFFK